MIQRIQTIFLLLASASFGGLFLLPLATSDQPTTMFLSDRVYDITDHPALLGLTLLGVVLGLIAIFLFKKRPAQVKLGYMVIVLAILLPLAAFLLFMNESAAAVQVSDEPGMFLPAGAILFGALAVHFIRKDEKLVKSMDRLR